MSSPALLHAGMEARDKAAIRAAFAPDVVLHSPIIEVRASPGARPGQR